MKVKELKKMLEEVDEDRIVILQKDPEGNGYSPLAGLDGENCSYQAETTWYGEVGLERLTPKLKKDGYTEEDVLEGEKAVVLWPIN